MPNDTEEMMIDTQEGILGYLYSPMQIKGQHVKRLFNGGLEMSVVVKGTIKGTATELEFAVDPSGHQFMTPGEMAYTELSRQGQGWSTMAVTAVGALVVRPSTTAAIEFWNGNTSGGPSLVVDRLFSQWLVASTTALGSGAQIWAMVTTAKAAPSTASLAIVGNSGKAYNGAVISAINTTVTANGWFPWGPTVKKESAGSVVPSGGMEAQVNGRIIVPPQCSLCLHVVSGYVADTFCSGATWYEKVFSQQQNPLF